jgi:hypothetical protein
MEKSKMVLLDEKLETERKEISQYIFDNIINKLKVKFQHYPELEYIINMITPLDNYCPTKFLNYINRLDSIRNTSWKTTFKELSTLLNND